MRGENSGFGGVFARRHSGGMVVEEAAGSV